MAEHCPPPDTQHDLETYAPRGGSLGWPEGHTFDQQQDLESHAPYGLVFFTLLNYTAMEYIYASFHTSHWLPLWLGLTAVLLLALTIIMSGVLRMHLTRGWVWLPLIPAIILSLLPVPLVLGLMVLAVIKASLVGLFFMHLKFEGNWVYLLLIPAAILATVFIVALYPDIGMQPVGETTTEENEEIATAPLVPMATAASHPS
ncbi:MAG: cytochrome C oxidase subunit IV family protein [Isosphaeraceae bacterium]|nr:cytochrome C oxidase subunit IV family protein [Isosphaeraceae bacterium]